MDTREWQSVFNIEKGLKFIDNDIETAALCPQNITPISEADIHKQIDSLVKSLDEICVSKKVIMKGYPFEFEYMVPVTRLCPFDYIKYNSKTGKILDHDTVNGQDVDLNYCYTIKDGNLKQYGKLIPDEIVFDNPVTKLFNTKCYFNGKYVNGNIFCKPTDYKKIGPYDSYRKYTPVTINDICEIQLNKPSYVTHIATMGDDIYNHVDKYIDKTTHKIRKDIDKKTNGAHRWEGKQLINYYNPIKEETYKYSGVVTINLENAKWTEEYELLYQDIKTKKWRSLGKFVGNTGLCDINLNDFPMVYAQKFRLIPLKTHNGGNVRIALFGLSTDDVPQHMHYKFYRFGIEATKKCKRKSRFLENNDAYKYMSHRHRGYSPDYYTRSKIERRLFRNGKEDIKNWEYDQTHIIEDDLE
uniref:F5/8 type C domain-containing protein n=1 Tax=viral metagenome TaxID=1070528 RepID=A0A6C0ECV3_9ZZZZ